MAVDIEALKAQLVDRAVMEAVTKVNWDTEDEPTKDASIAATTTIWALIDDLEVANAAYERVLRYVRDPRTQPLRDPRAGVTHGVETRYEARGSDVFGELET